MPRARVVGWAVLLSALIGASAGAKDQASSPQTVPLVDVRARDPRLALDVRYATSENFTGQRLYPVARCLLRPRAARMLSQAQDYLQARHPKLVLLIKDCYRPTHVQHTMWKLVRDTPKQHYVADPTDGMGSIHAYGAAVDLSLATKDGKELDMGTAYDTLNALSQPRYEERFLRAGKLTAKQLKNRRILRRAMVEGGGFSAIRNEWWHFNALRGRALRRRYQPLDVPLDVALSDAPKAGRSHGTPARKTRGKAAGSAAPNNSDP